MTQYEKIINNLAEVYDYLADATEEQKKEIYKNAKKDKNSVLQYILIEDENKLAFNLISVIFSKEFSSK